MLLGMSPELILYFLLFYVIFLGGSFLFVWAGNGGFPLVFRLFCPKQHLWIHAKVVLKTKGKRYPMLKPKGLPNYTGLRGHHWVGRSAGQVSISGTRLGCPLMTRLTRLNGISGSGYSISKLDLSF